jgi:hypothetical protein
LSTAEQTPPTGPLRRPEPWLNLDHRRTTDEASRSRQSVRAKRGSEEGRRLSTGYHSVFSWGFGGSNYSN